MKNKYYNVFDDLKLYPDNWLYVAYSMRGSGKTYGLFKGCLNDKIKFVYMKRTQIDIDLLLMEDFSPLKPINRDCDTEFCMKKMYDGIAGIYENSESENAIGYCLAISAVHKFKGFDLSEVDIICFDEFLPQLTERVNRKEGELLLDLYLTISRDREARGQKPLKMVLFANSTELYSPITETLNIVDDLSELNATGEEFKLSEDRGIVIHHILQSNSVNHDMKIYKAMQGTKWARQAFDGEFAYNDFSKVKRQSVKKSTCVCAVTYNRDTFYIYYHKNNGTFYMCRTKGACDEWYNLDIEGDVIEFLKNWAITLKSETTKNNMYYETYTAYNLIMRYNKIFKF